MSSPALTALTISGSVAFGMVLALLGRLKLALARRPEHVTGRVDLLLSVLNFALIPMMFAAGLLVDLWGVQQAMVAGSIVLALAFLALSAGPAYTRSVFAVTAAAVGATAVGVASLVLAPKGLFGENETTASLQFGLVLISLGALLTPPLIDVLLRGLGFGRAIAIMAFLMLTPAFLAWLAREEVPDLKANSADLLPLLSDQRVWAAGLVFFFYAPLEGFVSVWTTTLLKSIGEPERQVRWLAGFWGGLLLSRLAVAFIEHAGIRADAYSSWFLVGAAILSAVVIGNLSGAIRPQHAGTGLVFLGCFLGPVFPLLVGILWRGTYPEKMPGASFGLLYACGSVGSLALAPLVGLSARERLLQTALRIPLFIALLLTAATIVFALLANGVGSH